MKIKTIPFYADTSELAVAFLECRVALEFGNTSGLGVENNWCEIRTEPSKLALAYHEFEKAEDAEEFCKQFGTGTNVPADSQFNPFDSLPIMITVFVALMTALVAHYHPFFG